MQLILVADDQKDAAVFLAEILRREGYRVIQGYDGHWALESAMRG